MFIKYMIEILEFIKEKTKGRVVLRMYFVEWLLRRDGENRREGNVFIGCFLKW